MTCRLPLLSALVLACLAPYAGGQGFSPEEALKRMQVAEGLQVKLCASEPEVRQPLSLTFDERGRLWVIQYLQYPNPAGLKPVQVDQFLRTKYDRLPEPPPKGPRGADRITIFEDRDGSGRFRKVKDFVTGLNLASGMALGHGGVFVVQPPYLLFYPDRNGDDTPDGDPEVLLTGFGMEDAHAFANSLQWGPDGWLYGGQMGARFWYLRGPWVFDVMTKVALGVNHEAVNILGTTAVTTGAGVPTAPGGLLALNNANFGPRINDTTDYFAVAPEVKLGIGYQLSRTLRAMVAWDFLYLSGVARPGNHIDTAVNPTMVPSSPTFAASGPLTPATGPFAPNLNIRQTDFWAQGINLGLLFTY